VHKKFKWEAAMLYNMLIGEAVQHQGEYSTADHIQDNP
jgi:hypothetical protein